MASQRGVARLQVCAGPASARVWPAVYHPAGRRQPSVARAAARSNDAGWGDGRPDWVDTCLEQDGPGPLGDLDAEWQAFINSNGRHPQPLIWSADSIRPSSSSSSNSSASGGVDAPSTSNRGPPASSSNSSSKHYASSIQSFDDWDFAQDDNAIPVPCNLPAAANETMQHTSTSSSNSGMASIPSVAGPAAGEQQQQQQQLWPAVLSLTGSSRDLCYPGDLLGRSSLWHSLREVYVLLFGVGQKDTEGIYSLRAVSEDGLPTETIIAFQNMEDAVRYSGLLEATMEHSPYVCSIPPSELMSFCADSGYRCRLELEGSLLMPPDYNVHVTDWERSLRLREGKFSVLPEEPDYIHAAGSSSNADSPTAAGAAAAATPFQPGSGSSSSSSSPNGSSSSQLLLMHSEFTAAQLNTVKAQLEALLPATTSSDDDDLFEFGV